MTDPALIRVPLGFIKDGNVVACGKTHRGKLCKAGGHSQEMRKINIAHQRKESIDLHNLYKPSPASCSSTDNPSTVSAAVLQPRGDGEHVLLD